MRRKRKRMASVAMRMQARANSDRTSRQPHLLLELMTHGANVLEPSCSLIKFKALNFSHLPHSGAAYNGCHYCAFACFAFSAGLQEHPVRKAGVNDNENKTWSKATMNRMRNTVKVVLA